MLDDDFNHTGAPVSAAIPLKAGLRPVPRFYRHVSGTPLLKLEIAGPVPVNYADIPKAE